MTKEHLEKREVFKDRQQVLGTRSRPPPTATPTRKRPRRAASQRFTAGYFDEDVLSQEHSNSSSPSSTSSNTKPEGDGLVPQTEPFSNTCHNQNIFEYFTNPDPRSEDNSPDREHDAMPLHDKPGDQWEKGNWIHCDVRYFDFQSLGNNFDVVMLDPPWRLRGNEVQVTPRSMFTNSSFSLNYNTLTNEEIIDLPLEGLSQRGLLFLWVINSQLTAGLECMRRWGYHYANQIVWIKKTRNHKIAKSQGYYFLHSTEVCLIGTKGRAHEPFSMVVNRVANDILFGSVRQKSRKPEEIYRIIEEMLPGSRKIEIFARNHNIRPSWLSLGNQLGPHYDWERYRIICDGCNQPIHMGHTRYKSRFPPLMDLCTDCLAASPRERDHFLRLDNQVEEMVFHEYFECNLCKVQPIPGIRFTCSVCPGFDICEACFDKSPLWNDQIHSQIHAFIPREIPQLAGGLPIHRLRCSGCHTFPIIGYCFSCTQCQKCLFLKKEPRSHHSEHKMQIFIEENVSQEETSSRCVGCSMNPIQGARFQCNSCFHLNLCHECYWDNKTIDDSYVAHKHSHSYTCITDGLAVPFPPASSPSGKKHAAANILLESFVKHS